MVADADALCHFFFLLFSSFFSLPFFPSHPSFCTISLPPAPVARARSLSLSSSLYPIPFLLFLFCSFSPLPLPFRAPTNTHLQYNCNRRCTRPKKPCDRRWINCNGEAIQIVQHVRCGGGERSLRCWGDFVCKRAVPTSRAGQLIVLHKAHRRIGQGCCGGLPWLARTLVAAVLPSDRSRD